MLVPPAGLGIVMLADKLGFLPPDDKMFRFVLLLQHTMPTSVLSGKLFTTTLQKQNIYTKFVSLLFCPNSFKMVAWCQFGRLVKTG